MTIQDNTELASASRLSAQWADRHRFYARLPLPPTEPFALFAWEVLSRKALPASRDAAMANLRKAHVLPPDAVARPPRATQPAAGPPPPPRCCGARSRRPPGCGARAGRFTRLGGGRAPGGRRSLSSQPE